MDGQLLPRPGEIDPGETVTCTFTNTVEMGLIRVAKVTDPPGGNFFGFTNSIPGHPCAGL